MGYNYKINGEDKNAPGVRLMVGTEKHTLVDTAGLNIFVTGGKAQIVYDPNTSGDASDDKEFGAQHPILASEMDGAVTVEAAAGKAVAKIGSGVAAESAVTLAYEDGKVAAKVGGTTAVEAAADALGIPAGGAEKLVPSSGTYFKATQLTNATEKLVFPNKGAGTYIGKLIGTPLGNNSELFFLCGIISKNGGLIGAAIGFSESSSNPTPSHAPSLVTVSSDTIELTSVSGGRFGYNGSFNNYEIYYASEGSITG